MIRSSSNSSFSCLNFTVDTSKDYIFLIVSNILWIIFEPSSENGNNIKKITSNSAQKFFFFGIFYKYVEILDKFISTKVSYI